MATEVGKLTLTFQVVTRTIIAGFRRAGRIIKGFANTATRAFRSIDRRFGRLIKRIVGFGAVVAGLAGAFSFVGLIRGSIEAASEIQSFTIRLQTLIGSVSGAERVLDKLSRTAQKVAPSLRDVIEAAATLGTVSLGSEQGITRLTDTALNIAAVTGLSLEQTSQNLQRALASGIGAADLFRERGVRAVLEAVTGIPNLIEQPLSVVARAFEEVFGPEGTFGNVAELFAVTLPGTISVTGDAFFQLRRAIGETLSPVIVAGLRATIIPFFTDLAKLVKENETEIRTLATRGLRLLLQGLGATASILVKLIRFFRQFRVGLSGLRLRIARFRLSTAQLAASLPDQLQLPPEAAALSSADRDALRNRLALERAQRLKVLSKAVADLGAEQVEALQGTKSFEAGLASAQEEIAKFQKRIDDLTDAQVRNTAELQKGSEAVAASAKIAFATAAIRPEEKALEATERAQKRILNLLEQRGLREARSTEPLLARVKALEREARILEGTIEPSESSLVSLRQQEEQILLSLARAEDNKSEAAFQTARLARVRQVILEEEVRVDERLFQIIGGIEGIERDRLDVLEALRDARLDESAAVDDLAVALNRLAEIDQAAADAISARTLARQKSAVGAVAKTRVLRTGTTAAERDLKKALEAIEQQFQDSVFPVISRGIASALVEGARTGIIDFGELLASISSQLLEASLTKVLDDIGRQLSELLGDSGKLGAAIGGAIGLIGLFASRAFADTETAIQSAAVKSAITSTQAVRGIVAGPTQVAVAQVGNAIRDAFIETNGILRTQTSILEDLLESVRTSGLAAVAAGVGGSAASVLATESASLT